MGMDLRLTSQASGANGQPPTVHDRIFGEQHDGFGAGCAMM